MDNDPYIWFRERIYKPKERVRARRLSNGNWEVFDGAKIVTVNDEWFKDNYELAASSCEFNKQRKQHEYHAS